MFHACLATSLALCELGVDHAGRAGDHRRCSHRVARRLSRSAHQGWIYLGLPADLAWATAVYGRPFGKIGRCAGKIGRCGRKIGRGRIDSSDRSPSKARRSGHRSRGNEETPLKGQVRQRLKILGGAKGTRTPDLLPARQLLYQLSYGPDDRPGDARRGRPRACRARASLAQRAASIRGTPRV